MELAMDRTSLLAALAAGLLAPEGDVETAERFAQDVRAATQDDAPEALDAAA